MASRGVLLDKTLVMTAVKMCTAAEGLQGMQWMSAHAVKC